LPVRAYISIETPMTKDKFLTSFPPHFLNKTTSVAMEYHIASQPHYLIKNKVKTTGKFGHTTG
jgi:hypothetical protein